jgi:hypothetical protein
VIWSTLLEDHLAALRSQLLLRPDLWPMIAAQAGVSQTTVQGFARNYPLYRNPTLSTLQNISDAFDLVSKEFPDVI